MYLSGVEQPGDPVDLPVVIDEVLGQGKQHLPPHHLVAVHVAHVLDHGPEEGPVPAAAGRQAEAHDVAALRATGQFREGGNKRTNLEMKITGNHVVFCSVVE